MAVEAGQSYSKSNACRVCAWEARGPVKAAGAVHAGQMYPVHLVKGPLLACWKIGARAQQHVHSKRSWGLRLTMYPAGLPWWRRNDWGAKMQRQLQNNSKRCCQGSELTGDACRGVHTLVTARSPGATPPALLPQEATPAHLPHEALCHVCVGLTLRDAATPAHLQEEALCHIHGQH